MSDRAEADAAAAIATPKGRGFATVAFGAGIVLAVQSRINGQFTQLTGDGILAAVMTLAVGLVILLGIVAVRAGTRARLLTTLPAEWRARRLRWWHFIGGFGGASIVASQALTVPSLGVAMYTVLLVAAMTSASLGVDRAGIGPGGKRPVTPARLIGAVATTLAVGLAISDRISAGNFAWLAAALVLAAGVATTFQQAVNAVVAQRTRDPLAAGVVNFVGGFAALGVVYVAEHLLGSRPWVPPPAPWDQPVLWLAGPCGIAVIVSGAIVVRAVGVLLFSLSLIAGQLVGALMTDLIVPAPGTRISWQLVAGVVLTGLSVAYAGRSPRRSDT